MKQKSLKNTNGITLIALVVTIVVLLILAGISISMVLGNNGLITKAKDSKTQTEQDKVNTETAMNNLYDEMMDILGENDGTGGSGEDDNSDNTIDLSALAIGDYVNYTYDTVADGYSLLKTQSGYTGSSSGSYTSDGNQTVVQETGLKWRILNIDEENGTIDLVADPTEKTVGFGGSLGYNNGVYLQNDICAKLYSNSSLRVTARSINLVDMENHLTEAGFAARNAYANSVTYGTTKTYTGSYSYYPNLYANQLGAGINTTEITQPSIDGTVDPYNESSNYYSTPTTETYSQASDSGLTVTQTYYNIAINSTNYGDAASVLSNSNWYWVASRYVITYSSDAGFGLRYASTDVGGYYLFYSSIYSNNDYNSLRPVVSLSSSLLDGTKDDSGAWNLK